MIEIKKIINNGNIYWYKAGTDILYREDGPAVEYAEGTKKWFKNGKLHREDGPAIEFSNKSKAWYKEGKCHREDGPAIIYNDGNVEYWLNGKYYKNINSDEEWIIKQILE